MQKDWEEQNIPGTTLDLKDIQGKLNITSLMAEPSHKKPGTSALQQNTRSTIPFFAWGSADVTILLKSSYYISSITD